MNETFELRLRLYNEHQTTGSLKIWFQNLTKIENTQIVDKIKTFWSNIIE